MDRVRLVNVVLAVIVLMGFVVASTALGQVKPVKIRVGGSKYWDTWAFYVGQKKGFFKQTGIKVSWHEFANPNRVTQAIASGDLDAGASTGPHFLVAREKGVKILAVAMLEGRTDPPMTYFVRKDSGINRIEDLRGKKIGINNYGGNFDVYLRYMLEEHGINHKKDVQILEVPFSAMIQAITTKRVDSIAELSTFAILINEKFGDKLKPLFDFTDVGPLKGHQVNNMIVILSEALVRRHRPAAKAFMKGYVQAVRYAIKHPQEALDIWAEVSGIGLVKKIKSFASMPFDGRIDRTGMQFDIDLMYRFGYTKTRPRAAEVIYHSLIEEVLAEAGAK